MLPIVVDTITITHMRHRLAASTAATARSSPIGTDNLKQGDFSIEVDTATDVLPTKRYPV